MFGRKIIGLAKFASPTLRRLSERISSGVGQARGYSIGIRGKRADAWSPHTVLGRGVPSRGIVASSHGLGCEYGYRDQRGRHEGHFGHFASPYGGRSRGNDRLLPVKSGQPREIFHHALSTKRELLWSRPVTAAAVTAGERVRREIIRAGAVAAVSDACANRRTGSPQRGPFARH
jgi:hypothetical protein